MKTLFTSLGYIVSDKKISNSIRMEFCYISNPDGTPRWIWPSYLERPLFLKFYKPEGWRSSLYVVLVKLAFALSLPYFVFKTKTYYVKTGKSCLFDFCMEDQWTLNTSSTGLNSSTVVLVGSGKEQRFMRLGPGSCRRQFL